MPETLALGTLYTAPDVDEARAFFAQKSRAMVDKVMPVSEAVKQFVHDGDYFASGGFGGVRIATSVLHEIVRQHKTNLGFAGHTATHDFQIMSAGKTFNRCDVAYVVGLELRGLSLGARRWLESGNVHMTEWSNATLGWRYKAAAMGLPFLPARSLMGSDTYKYSGAKEITCPFTGQKLVAVPALFPDVGVIHVHRADKYGNAQIEGITIADWDIARCCKRLIVTTEKIVSTEEIRKNSCMTQIPYYLVDAVCHVPFGSYPGNMPFEYFSDERHLAEWMESEKDEPTLQAFLDKYIYGTKNFEEYLQLAAGDDCLQQLQSIEPLRQC